MMEGLSCNFINQSELDNFHDTTDSIKIIPLSILHPLLAYYYYMIMHIVHCSMVHSIFIPSKMYSCYRLVNTKCMGLVEQWKKMAHSNLVTLRQVIYIFFISNLVRLQMK